MKHSSGDQPDLFQSGDMKIWYQTLKRRTNDRNVSLAVIYYVNNIEGKITECWLVNKESNFP